jgi:hypothetical protein
MDIAQVPLTETGAYNIHFGASRREGDLHKNGSVYIDDVQIVKSPCEIYPPTADPDYCYPSDLPINCTFDDATFCEWKNIGESWDFSNIMGNMMITF